MFSLLVALTLYVAFSPVRPALSVADYLPHNAAQAHLEPAAARPDVPVRSPFKTDERRLGVDTTAKAAVILDWRTGRLLFEKNPDLVLPIASMTKLMTALVTLDAGVDFDSFVEILPDDQRQGDVSVLLPGEKVRISDLFRLTLIASSNDAAAALARATGLAEVDFVRRMNDKARELDMTGAIFTDPTGLDSGNAASARGMALLLRQALNEPEISGTVISREYAFTPEGGAMRRVRNTDLLLNSFLNRPPYVFLGGKTGFLNEAGYCFGAGAANGDGDRVVAVVLGSATRDDRFNEVKALLWWAFDVWHWEDPSS